MEVVWHGMWKLNWEKEEFHAEWPGMRCWHPNRVRTVPILEGSPTWEVIAREEWEGLPQERWPGMGYQSPRTVRKAVTCREGGCLVWEIRAPCSDFNTTKMVREETRINLWYWKWTYQWEFSFQYKNRYRCKCMYVYTYTLKTKTINICKYTPTPTHPHTHTRLYIYFLALSAERT